MRMAAGFLDVKELMSYAHVWFEWVRGDWMGKMAGAAGVIARIKAMDG